MFRRTEVCAGVMLALGGGLIGGSAVAQQPALERVEIALYFVNKEELFIA